MSADVQELRSQAESGIADAVTRVNQLLQNIAAVSDKLTGASSADMASAALLDQRDADIAELSGLIDIRVNSMGNNQLSIFTTSGVSLYDGQASTLTFDARPALNPYSAYNVDPNERGVGTISLTVPNGSQIDLIRSNSIRSGSIAGMIEMRDDILVKAQAQLDEIANSLALALSNRTETGEPVTGGPPDGFDLDLAGLKNGNTVSLRYTDNVTGAEHSVTIVGVGDASSLPLDNSSTADPNDQVIGVDLSGGMASVAAQLNAALGAAHLTFSASGDTLTVLDDGAPNLADVNGFDASITTDTFNSGDLTLPFFTDGGSRTLYTGAINAGGEQKTGFAGRIVVNPDLLSNPSALVLYAGTTNAGDSSRPDFISRQLTAAAQLFDPAGGIGTAGGPFSGSLADYIQQTISLQGANADNAAKLNDGQQVVVNALQTRYNDSAGVNIDTEMSNLLVLQTAYGANARVMTAIKQMFDQLLNIGS
jgi:flagellar hook-associated protein 1 FlgK